MIRYNKEKNANEIALVEYFTSLNGEGHSAGLQKLIMKINLRCHIAIHKSINI